MISVLLGGLGRERGGRLERSKVREGLDLDKDWDEDECEVTILLLLLLVWLCSSDNNRSFFDKVWSCSREEEECDSLRVLDGGGELICWKVATVIVADKPITTR